MRWLVILYKEEKFANKIMCCNDIEIIFTEFFCIYVVAHILKITKLYDFRNLVEHDLFVQRTKNVERVTWYSHMIALNIYITILSYTVFKNDILRYVGRCV